VVSVKLLWFIEVSPVCGGVIASSGNGRFCVRKSCDVKSHRSNKILMKDNHLYILGKRKDQALVEPILDADSVTGGADPSKLEDIEKPINVRRAYFSSETERAGRSTNESEKSWEEVEIPSLTKLSEVDATYRTPKKLKVGTLLEVLADTIPIGISKAERIAVIQDHMLAADGSARESARSSSLRTVLAEWNKVCVGVDLFNLEFQKLGKGEETSRESISGTIIKIHEAIRDTDARASLLGSRIGQDDTAASGEGSESVWDTIRRLCDAIAEVRELAEAGAKAIPEVLERSEGLLDKMSHMSKNLIGLNLLVQSLLIFI
jgi:hypothetical protein